MPDVSVTYPRIESALAVVEEELAATRIEAEAFEAFLARLRRIDPTASVGGSDPVSVGGGSLTADPVVRGIDPDRVTTAYRETVMAMDHYDSEYGEPLVENVRLEFGDSIGELLAVGKPIPPVQRDVIATATERAVEERRQFERVLTDEQESLRSVRDRLGEVERAFQAYRDGREPPGDVDRHGDLAGLSDDCQALSAGRQRSLHWRPTTPTISGVGDRSLVEYLYGEDDHRFPALVEIADVASRIEAAGVDGPGIDGTYR